MIRIPSDMSPIGGYLPKVVSIHAVEGTLSNGLAIGAEWSLMGFDYMIKGVFVFQDRCPEFEGLAIYLSLNFQ